MLARPSRQSSPYDTSGTGADGSTTVDGARTQTSGSVQTVSRVLRRAAGRRPDRQVGLAFAQIAQQIVDLGAVELEMQVGPVGAGAFEPERRAGRGDVSRGADADGLRGKPRTRDIENLVVDRQKPPRVVDDQFAGRREAHARRALVEQVGAQKALQSLDLRADRRLCHAEGLGSLGKAAQVHHGDQCPQELGWDVGHGRSVRKGWIEIAVPPRLVRAVVATRSSLRSLPHAHDAARQTMLRHLIVHFHHTMYEVSLGNILSSHIHGEFRLGRPETPAFRWKPPRQIVLMFTIGPEYNRGAHAAPGASYSCALMAITT